ncbi:leucine-rich repeat protein [uncultured Treponema sp.]|uniref:leucine-rich repeat protein n=1 Tax=uncultured Treponema sp. TaxID=162155 RepID=UPI0025F49C51|nr:leucine-rich repeat protein [uncultured Treponema sp.]
MANYNDLYFCEKTQTSDITVVHFAYSEKAGMNGMYLTDKLAEKAFFNDESLEALFLDRKVTEISEFMCEGCKELRLIEYVIKAKSQETDPEVLKNNEFNSYLSLVFSHPITVKKHAFSNCPKLHTVVFPKMNENEKISIGEKAFAKCPALRTVVIPNGNAIIARNAFKGCRTDKLVFVSNMGKNCKVAQFANKQGFRFVTADNF